MLSLTPKLIQLIVFTTFFAITGVAFIFHKNRWVRMGFGLVFGVSLLVPGLSGRSYWPFFSWHLFGLEQTEHITFHEFRLSDKDGQEIKYDERAVPPTLATPLRRLAADFPNLSEEDQEEIGRFLLTNANEYRQQILETDPSVLSYLKFPPHQIGFAWTDENLSHIGPYESLVVYKVRGEFSPDGQKILTVEKELLTTITLAHLSKTDD